MSSTEFHIIVLGAGYAGMTAAYRLAGTTKARITLVNAADVFVERIRLHQRAVGTYAKTLPLSKMLRGTRIQFVQGWVTAIRPDARLVEIKTSTGAQQLAYDALVYALGSTIDRDGVPGIREHAHVLTGESVAALRQKLESLPAEAQLVVCGGGLTGIEAVTEFAEAHPHIQVTMITREKLGARLSQKAQAYLQKTFKRLNITVHDGITIQRIDSGAVVTDGGEFPFDAVLWAGSFAVSPLASDSGIKTNVQGQILIDSHMRSLSHPDIFAAGDAANPAEYPFTIRMACATAIPMGLHVANSVSQFANGKPLTDQYEFSYALQCISLGRHDGLVQMVNPDDSPREQIYTGRWGAFIKELICRYTIFKLQSERYFPGLFRYTPRKKTRKLKPTTNTAM